MASGRWRIYWDSNVWLCYINDYPQFPERKPVLDALLADSKNSVGDREIFTSVFSQTEVAFALFEQEQRALDEDIEAQIDSLWADTTAIKMVEFHPLIAIEARNLIRLGLEHGWHLKPQDATHLATAKAMDVDEFHTYEGNRMTRYSEILGFPIHEPRIGGLNLPSL